jgi:hypothetical protein
MLQFVISAVRENNRGSVDRLSNWELPISGEIGGSFPDTEGDTWFYAALDTPLGYTMPSGMGGGNGSSPTQVTDVVLRPFYLDENPSPEMRAFPMDFAVVLDSTMLESGVIDVNLVDFIAVVEVDGAMVHSDILAAAAPDVAPAVEVEEPEPTTLEDVTFPAQDVQEPEPEVFSVAGNMRPDPHGPVTIPQVDLSEFSQEMELSEFVPEDPSPDELPPIVPQVELPAAAPQAGPPAFIPQFELPPTVQQAELPPAIPQAAPPTFVPQAELAPTVPQAEIPQVELPPTVPQADLADFAPAPKPPPAKRRVIDRPAPVREEVVFNDVAARAPRNTGPLKLAAAGAAVLALGWLGFSALFSRGGDTDATAAQTDTTTTTETSSTTPPAPVLPPPPSPEDIERVRRALPPGYAPDVCPPAAVAEDGGIATLACGRNGDPGGPVSGLYTVFGDRTSLYAAVDRAVAASGQMNCPGNIQSPGPWRRNAAPEREVGTLFCGTRDQNPVVIWSDTERLMLNIVQGAPEGPDLVALYGWWTQHS